MTKEKIEEFAIQKWGELYNGSYPYLIGVEWEFFLKGIEVALNEYKYTKDDMKSAIMLFASDYEPTYLPIDRKADLFLKREYNEFQ